MAVGNLRLDIVDAAIAKNQPASELGEDSVQTVAQAEPGKFSISNPGSQGGFRLPEPYPDSAEKDPELYMAWRKHIIAGFEHNEEMFKRILEAFIKPYQATVWMYRILFGIGVGSFLFAAIMSAATKESSFGLIFGGLGVVAFLSYFISRPLQALEQNLQFITWLGVVYNTYWARLASMRDPASVQKDLQEATRDATGEIEKIIATHADLSGKRPSLNEK